MNAASKAIHRAASRYTLAPAGINPNVKPRAWAKSKYRTLTLRVFTCTGSQKTSFASGEERVAHHFRVVSLRSLNGQDAKCVEQTRQDVSA
jgi:hypothetical protein